MTTLREKCKKWYFVSLLVSGICLFDSLFVVGLQLAVMVISIALPVDFSKSL